MKGTTAFRITAILGALAVGLGAFGAHGLKALLEQNQAAATWQTAVFYHFAHTLAMLLVARMEPFRRGPWLAFLVGIILFSGSLYALSLTKITKLGIVTPFGGVSFIVGWVWLAVCRGTQRSES